jgi:repressor LexA
VPTLALTKRQLQILDFYRAYGAENGVSPTLEEVATHFGVNKVTIFGHVAELERKGALARSAKGVSRGLLVVEHPQDEGARGRTRVTVLGRIAAGSPIEAIESPEEMDLASLLPADRDVYALRVFGDSMIDAGIHDGDVVIVERREFARDGEMVVAITDDEEATLKRLYREGRRFRLQPANPSLQPLVVDSVRVRGVVIGVVRKY